MRIVGGKDYYDHGLAYGVDEQVVFVRTGQRMHQYRFLSAFPYRWGTAPSVRLTERGGAINAARNRWGEPPSRTATDWWHNGTSYRLDGVGVVFCGHYYGGARLRSYTPQPAEYGYGRRDEWRAPYNDRWPVSETYWDQNSLGRRLAKCGARVFTEGTSARGAGRFSTQTKPFYRAPLPQPMLQQLIELGVAVATHCSEDQERVKRKGYSHETEEAYWRVNDATLHLFDFVKVVDPVQAFQQLSMWVGGVLPQPGAKTVEITDDKVKAHKAGFDQWSFRKMPEKAK